MREKAKVWFKENWFKIGILIIFIITITSALYWVGWRNPHIIKKCQSLSMDKAESIKGDRIDAIYYYEKCLKENGLQQ